MPSVMINQGRTWGEDLTPIIDALKTLRDYGESKKLQFLSKSGDLFPVETLVKVIRESGINANPDMGNLKDEETTENGLRLLYPLA